MTRREFTAALALLPASLRGTDSQHGDTLQEKGKRIIDQCIQGLGGDAFRQMPGHLEIGRGYHFYNDKMTGFFPAKIYTKYIEPQPGNAIREVQRQELGKKGDEVVILTGTEGWDITYKGAEAVTEENLDKFREILLTDIFYILRARLHEPNTSLFSRGADVVENEPAEIVDYYDSDNRSVTVWINSTTWLPVRQLVKRWDPLIKDRRDEFTHFTKYRDAGNGVMWPHEIQRDSDGEKTYQLISDKVTIGVFNDSMFELPPGEKILKKM